MDIELAAYAHMLQALRKVSYHLKGKARRDPEERAIVEQIDDAIAAAEKENTG